MKKQHAIAQFTDKNERVARGIKLLPAYMWPVFQLNKEQVAAFDSFEQLQMLAYRSPFRDSLNRDVRGELSQEAEKNVKEHKKQLLEVKNALGNDYYFAVALTETTLEGELSPDCVKAAERIASKLIRFFD